MLRMQLIDPRLTRPLFTVLTVVLLKTIWESYNDPLTAGGLMLVTGGGLSLTYTLLTKWWRSMSTWTHVICQSCWNKRNDVRDPMQMRDAPEEQCCYCQRMSSDGLYIREKPTNVPCQGKTGVHSEDI